MRIYIHRRKQYLADLTLYAIYLNGKKNSDIANGETKSLDLGRGGYSLQLESYMPPENIPPVFVVQWYRRHIHPKSNKIELDVGKDGNSGRYFIARTWDRSPFDELRRLGLRLYRKIQSRTGPYPLVLEEVSKEDFHALEKKPMKPPILLSGKTMPETPETNRLVRNDIIIGLLTGVFGLYVFFQMPSRCITFGLLLCYVGIGSLNKLRIIYSKSALRLRYWVAYFRYALNFAILIMLFINTIKFPAMAALSLVFMVLYAYLFFKAKRISG